MKSILTFLFLISTLLFSGNRVFAQNGETDWKLIWEDQFEGDELDTTRWSLISTQPSQYDRAPDWKKHMIADERVYAVKNGNFYLTGINNPGIENDDRPFLTGGVESKEKFSFTYGKVEIRAKKECAQGAWPALWMMPEEGVYGGWPHSGEIDIMEHLNYDSVIHHTVHTRYTNVLNNTSNPQRGIGNVRADVTQWNIYGLEWHPDVLIWTVNGIETFRYPRVEGLDEEMKQWPFDQPFYFILSQQLGGSWVGEVEPEKLPVFMIVDYVKVFQKLQY
ncbi:Glycosyl hydrolases family 16 [Tangfeifania diversioriginum]|uniref:Glycosyl hydrolases family 16 n=1 Tax=Tangfeifania diversioriginum TaxID=1168035 RepID=A0A1M6PGK7_9BACT|nr:glycoside hydrolase family 16 protein [Tangfeifania diversioriginum]SHK07088.1 Glycosyl hydrolases family 16 [Tangfeifania diversioriginum]